MIVERNGRVGQWNVFDRGRGFAVDAHFAHMAYREHIKELIDRDRRGAFVSDAVPLHTTHLPSFREFLELLAAERWEREGIQPSEVRPPSIQLSYRK